MYEQQIVDQLIESITSLTKLNEIEIYMCFIALGSLLGVIIYSTIQNKIMLTQANISINQSDIALIQLEVMYEQNKIALYDKRLVLYQKYNQIFQDVKIIMDCEKVDQNDVDFLVTTNLEIECFMLEDKHYMFAIRKFKKDIQTIQEVKFIYDNIILDDLENALNGLYHTYNDYISKSKLPDLNKRKSFKDNAEALKTLMEQQLKL